MEDARKRLGIINDVLLAAVEPPLDDEIGHRFAGACVELDDAIELVEQAVTTKGRCDERG
jgi:hypothetical protein